jgi:serine/threonine-protein kinase
MLAKAGRFPLEKVLDIAIQIAGALTVAEENNILHRDIKPANILFTEKGAAKLADLGLAKTYLDSGEDSGITQTGIACGTPLYFSPEQAKGAQDLDIRSDIYSLGITLYHLLQGSPPFRGESAYVIFQKHVHEELPPFDLDDSSVPEPVFLLIKKMTAKKREERFASAKELSDVLTTLKKELVLGHKPSGKKGLLERLGIRRAS